VKESNSAGKAKRDLFTNGTLPQTPVHSFLYKREQNQEKVFPCEEFRAALRQASRELIKTRSDKSGFKINGALLRFLVLNVNEMRSDLTHLLSFVPGHTLYVILNSH